MALQRSALTFRSDVFPLRVIDLSATLHSHGGVIFADATDWSFHVISHTWSEKIRELSKRVGVILGTEEARSAGLKYNDCFAKSQFAGEAPYEKVIDFFRLLVADGAKKIWFDALCINQTDDDEKAAEIANLGAYYALSTGCYVAVHGIGTDVGLRALEDDSTVPRWFTRVWTYQESVLPKNLMFIVERFDAHFCSLLQAKLPHGYPEGFVTESVVAWSDWDKELMQECNPSETYFRRRIVCEEGSMSERNLYVLGKAAYQDMLLVLRMNTYRVSEYRLKTKGKSAERSDKFAQLWSLTDPQKNEEDIDVEVVVRQIQRRECSVEEDRVLGMLGLLGFEGELQVRSNQTLQQQLLWLAHMLMKENPNLLVNLCAAGAEGYHEMPCAAWLPDLQYRIKHLNGPVTSEYIVVRSRDATVVGVKQDGKLVIRARSIQGSLIRLSALDQSVSAESSGMVHKTLSHAVSLQVEDPRPPYENMELISFDVKIDHDTKGGEVLLFVGVERWFLARSCFAVEVPVPETLFWAKFCIPAPSIHKLFEYEHPCPCTIFQPTLLFLGHNEKNKVVIMLCIRDFDSRELHKVAVLCERDSQPGFRSTALFVADPQEHVIGGFGNDLTRFLTKECQEIMDSNTSRPRKLLSELE